MESSIILSNTKIVLSNDVSHLEQLQQSIDYVINAFIQNDEQRNIKLYLVDECEENIFDSIIVPLVEHYTNKLYSDDFSFVMPYFMMYVETNKQSYTEQQLKWLDECMVGFVQTIDTMPNQEYVNQLHEACPDCLIKLRLNSNNYQQVLELFNSISEFYTVRFEMDWDNCHDVDFDELFELLTQYTDIAIDMFEDSSIPLVANNLINGMCLLVMAYHAQESDVYRTLPISQIENRVGTGHLGDYYIQDGCLYLNPYTLGHEENKIGTINGSSIVHVSDLIAQESKYECDQCNSCYLNRICNNANPWINMLHSGTYNQMSINHCKWENMWLELASRMVSHFDVAQDNDLFRICFSGFVKRGVRFEY